jgi:predicted dehydrogenase/threonine dehydrogenase-like Zn-dependent dehydrogenase
MKQLLQNLSSGKTEIIEAPSPRNKSGKILINTSVSLVSIGTERMLVDFGRANLINKARQQPEKVRQVIDKAKTDGVLATFDAVNSKLNEPIPLGYSNVGVVDGVGDGVEGFSVGDRVLSNGRHADVVSVPKNLCVRIPDKVSNETAVFTVVASIGLQGVRLAKPTVGENFVVMGTGLIGLLTVQILLAHGCRVLAIDFDEDKLSIAREYGAETCNLGSGIDPVAVALAFSEGNGVDSVIVTASTQSSEPMTQAANMCRKRGRIVLVGVTGLSLNRADFYEKELSFQVSCSYGPGRYDSNYEELGHDYPFAFVRWTERRNFEAILNLMADGKIKTEALISNRYKFQDASEAYEVVSTSKSALGLLLQYDSKIVDRHITSISLEKNFKATQDKPSISFIGAGNYASRVLIPSFKKLGVNLQTIVSLGGTSAVSHGNRNGFSSASTSIEKTLSDDNVDAVAIVTRHNNHAELTVQALKAGKHVFVEKPLAMNLDELKNVQETYKASKAHLMVGFNRRFAPHIQTIKKLLDNVTQPKNFLMVMNAGEIPIDHWTQDKTIGGGRIIGEACHYIDLMRYLAGHKIVSVQTRRMGKSPGVEVTEDKAVIMLGFEDGSFGTIHYLANGGQSFPKERIEVFAQGGTLQLDNFLSLKGYNWPGFKKQSKFRQAKGREECIKAFLDAISGAGPTAIPSEELFEVAKVTIEIAENLRNQA